MPKLSRKIELFTESVIARMSRIAEASGAINLAEGFPDFPPPQAMCDRLSQVAQEGPHQYSMDPGAANLRQAMADCRRQFTGQTIDPEKEVVVTCGGTEALMAAMMTLVDPGDKVILFSPFYEAYSTDALLCGATITFPCGNRTILLMAMNWKRLLNRGRKSFFCATRPIPAARSSAVTS